MTQPSYQTQLPSLSHFPSTIPQLDAFPTWSTAPTGSITSSYSRVPSPPYNSTQQSRGSSNLYTSSPSPYLPPLQPHLEDSPPPAFRSSLGINNANSPNSVSTGSRSPVHTPRDSTYYNYSSALQAEAWQPKPRVWTEQPLFEEFTARSTSPRMQAYTMQGQYMLPVAGSSMNPNDYALPPPTFGGGLGAAFPELLPPAQPQPNPYGEPSMQHHMMMDNDPFRIASDRPHVGPAEYAQVSHTYLAHRQVSDRSNPCTDCQALEAYQHIRAALPHIRPADMVGPPPSGQSYRTILECASAAVGVLSGRVPAKSSVLGARPRYGGYGGHEAKRPRMHHGDKDKPAPYCRGCGATETPEWRRGPLGPRTLCNACVSARAFRMISQTC